MSIRVELDELREQVAACGPYAYLLTVTEDGRPHAVSLRIEWDGGDLVAAPGPRTVANAERGPEVSLLWPVSGRDGFALFVNGPAEVRVDGETTKVAVKPASAVLHKTPEGEAQAPGCVPVMGR
ncbi:MAG TPA: pyridoxamine 5'-phosphate oxidase family protein [Acidimicrobiia bacterium]|nr:pyridoxamine 5'-phosphate oxidase family protein [Acidimicrobiia bacterium]